MTLSFARFGPAAITGAFAAVALVVGLWLHGPAIADVLFSPAPTGYAPERLQLLYADLPRLAIALLCGAGLGASGAIMQQVLRNPLAAPTTLGVDAGARLALAFAMLFTPALFGFGRDLVALGGSLITTCLVFLIARRDLSAISLILAGLLVSLYCGALSAIVTLVNERYLSALFIWGAGALDQKSWVPTLDLSWRLALAAVPVALLARPLALLDLGEDGARAVGLPVSLVRVVAIFLAVVPAALVTSAVGVIGFIGLVAPLLVRLSGASRFATRLVWSPLLGAAMLAATDMLVQLATANTTAFLPTGTVTAVVGAPLLLLLLPRLRRSAPPPPMTSSVVRPRAPWPWRRVAGLAAACLVGVAVAVCVGRAPQGGWEWLSGTAFAEAMPWRLPRVLAAGGAGAMLAVAGLILQRLTGNAMASPEVLGVSAGAAMAFAATLLLAVEPGPYLELAVTTAGGLAVLGAILLIGRTAGFRPETVLLAGIALNALLDTFVGFLTAAGDPNAYVLLDWMGGSTHSIGYPQAFGIVALAIALVALVTLAARWIDLLPLGEPSVAALGVSVPAMRFMLLTLAAVLTAAATPIVGPLTFVGLMAPHIAASLGLTRALPMIASSALAGVAVMTLADWLARTIAFPYQLPTGLVAALVGAPWLMLLLQRRRAA